MIRTHWLTGVVVALLFAGLIIEMAMIAERVQRYGWRWIWQPFISSHGSQRFPIVIAADGIHWKVVGPNGEVGDL